VNVLFLDIDGVLNSAESRARGTTPEDAVFDPIAVARLDRIVVATGARIVVSSAWRCMNDAEAYIDGLLRERGFHHGLLDVTPEHCDPRRGNRGREIDAWLARHAVGRFVIVDDEWDFDEHHRPYLVKTCFATGLLDEHVEAAISILGAADPRP